MGLPRCTSVRCAWGGAFSPPESGVGTGADSACNAAECDGFSSRALVLLEGPTTYRRRDAPARRDT